VFPALQIREFKPHSPVSVDRDRVPAGGAVDCQLVHAGQWLRRTPTDVVQQAVPGQFSVLDPGQFFCEKNVDHGDVSGAVESLVLAPGAQQGFPRQSGTMRSRGIGSVQQ
jgi:hypothetical protein